MSNEWLDELRKLRQADQATQPAPPAVDSNLVEEKKRKRAAELLRKSKAHELLRQVQKTLLNGQGTLDFFDRAQDYERVISLAWQGPISAARRLDPDDPEPYHYILVGVKADKLWVNGVKLPAATPQAMQAALLQACQNPGRETLPK
jgi:hypothetical protein